MFDLPDTTNRRLLISTAFLVVANLIPVIGVLFWGWDAFYLMMLFWCENVIIGFFGVLKALISGAGVFTSAFFAVHYGGFMFGHLMVLLALFANPAERGLADAPMPEIVLDAIQNRVTLLPIVALFISHAWSFATNFLQTDERHNLSGAQAMAAPYRRMVITHIALLAGGFALESLGQPVAGLMVLVAMKIVLDVVFHRKEHASSRATLSEAKP